MGKGFVLGPEKKEFMVIYIKMLNLELDSQILYAYWRQPQLHWMVVGVLIRSWRETTIYWAMRSCNLPLAFPCHVFCCFFCCYTLLVTWSLCFKIWWLNIVYLWRVLQKSYFIRSPRSFIHWSDYEIHVWTQSLNTKWIYALYCRYYFSQHNFKYVSLLWPHFLMIHGCWDCLD